MRESTAKRSSSPLVDPGRVQAFSDGVFAIIITLLVLDVRVPEYQEGQLWHALLAEWPALAAFTVSFIYVGALWLNHHALFRHIAGVDLGFQWLNLLLLLGTVLLPFPTAVIASALAKHAVDPGDQRVAVALYSVLAMLMSATWAAVWIYLARHPQLLTPATEPGWARAQLPRPATGVALFAFGAIAGWLLSPVIGLICLVAMIFYHAFTSEGLHPRR